MTDPTTNGAGTATAPQLAPNHDRLIKDSAITAEVVAARGYFTARTKAELKRLGFADYQQLPPALVVPVFGVTGEIVNYQIRPDKPRIPKSKNGKLPKPLKYETVADSRMALDVPPGARQWLGDPAWPLFITEGARKADAAVSKGLCCVDILGVWNWRGENEDGGLTALADWESIALKGRKVYLAFDSDIIEKKSVYAAMKRLKPFLELRGADVKIIYLPSGDGGAKVGLDDFFAQGRAVDELLQLATDKLRGPVDDPPGDLSIPRGFVVLDTGIHAQTDDGDRPMFICSPMNILAHTRADDSTSWGKLLDWADYDGVTHKWAMGMEELAGDGKDWLKRLMGEGLRVGSSRKAKERLSDYIQSSNPKARARCVTRPGWHGAAYVDAVGAIGAPDGEQIILQTSADWPRGFDVRGTLDEWRTNIAQHCRGNSLLLFAASAAFSAKLVGPLRVENAGFHFRASSSQGKTTTVQVAASVDGDGAEKGGFVESWRATANGLEAVCERHNDSILPLDELAQCDPHVAGEAAYLIINGQGKGRMNRAITARRRMNWRTMLLSTGEISLATHVLQAGKRTRAGQEVRLLDIPVGEHSHGLFGDLHGFPNGRAFADHLKVAAGQYYGVAGREFVRQLIEEWKDFALLQTAFDTFLKVDFLPNLPTSQASNEVTRAATKFALVAFGGEFATAYQLTGWEEGEATTAAIELFKVWLQARGSNGRGDDDVMIRQIRLFIEQHGESRFRRLDRADDRTINNRAGYFDGEFYYFSRESFGAEVCKGYDPLHAAKALERRELLTTNHGLQFKKHDPETGKTISFYAVSATILE